jgi:hypothetical protein
MLYPTELWAAMHHGARERGAHVKTGCQMTARLTHFSFKTRQASKR